MTGYIARQDTITKVLLSILLAVTLLNAFLHDPDVGYDAGDYSAYINALSQGRLPGPEDTHEFFTPPLPFAIPALLLGLFGFPLKLVLKLAQGINVLLAFASALALMKISDLVAPGNSQCKNLALAFLLTLPVFYKTHAFVRAEPYLLTFLLLYVHKLLEIWKARTSSYRGFISSGLLFGAMILSRQWGIFILPGVALFAVFLIFERREARAFYITGFILSGLIAILLSGWFYLSLGRRFGSVAKFNRDPAQHFSLANQPRAFYLGSGNGKLFTDPIRASFNNQLIPILYSETWGDYWEYFVVYGEDLRTNEPIQGGYLALALKEEPIPGWLETNRFEISAYLGRVNLVSLAPSGLAILGLILGSFSAIRGPYSGLADEDRFPLFFFITIIAGSVIGYLWFLIRYPSPNGDTIKATYLLQIYPFIALVLGLTVTKFAARVRWAYPAGMAVVHSIFVHNLGTVITRFLS